MLTREPLGHFSHHLCMPTSMTCSGFFRGANMKKFCNWVTYGIDMEQRKRLLWLVVIWVIFALAMLWIISGIGRANASTILVHAGDDLQSKLNGASPGDMLVLDAGAAWTAPSVLPSKVANAVV